MRERISRQLVFSGRPSSPGNARRERLWRFTERHWTPRLPGAGLVSGIRETCRVQDQKRPATSSGHRSSIFEKLLATQKRLRYSAESTKPQTIVLKSPG